MNISRWEHLTCYSIIAEHYGTQTTKRSKVPLINHIEEGLEILSILKVRREAMEAYCLHPIFQGDDALSDNFHKISDHTWYDRPVSRNTLVYVMEYRNVANRYLKHHYKSLNDRPALSPLREVNQMLIADKLQNFKDFMMYHYGVHSDSALLYNYFSNWCRELGVWHTFDRIAENPHGWSWTMFDRPLLT